MRSERFVSHVVGPTFDVFEKGGGGGGGGSGTVTTLTEGTGINLTPNTITTSGSVALADTAVTPGSYTSTNLTVDQQGRITAAASGTGGAAVMDFYGYYGAGSPIDITTDTGYDLPLDTELYKTGLIHSTVTNSEEITVPAGGAGTYVLVGKITPQNTTSSSKYVYQLNVVLNNSALGNYAASEISGVPDAAIETHSTVQVVTELELADGDVLKLHFNKTSSPASSAAQLVADTSEIHFFSLVRTSGGSGGGGGGGVTSITSGTGITLSPSTITGVGSVALTVPVATTSGGTATTTTFTAGSVVFAGASGVYTQNNSNLSWDNTNNILKPKTVQGTVWDKGGMVYNVKAYGAKGDGSTNDTVAVDAAWTAVTATGGVIYFPIGRYNYNGTGLFVSTSTEGKQVCIVGDGAGPSGINFTVSNADCIKLASTVGFSDDGARGFVVRDIELFSGQSTKNVLTVSGLIECLVENVYCLNGNIGLNVVECTQSTFRNINISDFNTNGVKITAETHGGNLYDNITAETTVSGAGWAFDWLKVNTTDPGGTLFKQCVTNSAGASSGGFRIQANGSTGIFVQMSDCISDASFGAPAARFKNVNYVFGSNNYWGNTHASGVAVEYDNCAIVSHTGGFVFGTGTGINFKNGGMTIGVSNVSGIDGSGTPVAFDGGTYTNVKASGVGISSIQYGSSSHKFTLGSGADVASATTITPTGNVFHVTGTTTITDMTVLDSNLGPVTIIFDGILTFTDGNHLKLAGNFVTSAADTITLFSDGTNYYEQSRSVN